MRRDKCKCGRYIVWEDGYNMSNEVTCKFCKTKYTVQSDDITVFWLEEQVLLQTPWKTEAK